MGGIFLCPRSPDSALDDIKREYRKSLDVFRGKQLELDCCLIRSGFALFRFKKNADAHEHAIEFANGNFIVYSGTLLYEGRVGPRALNNLYQDFSARRNWESNISGSYLLSIYSEGVLTVIGDFSGYYPAYCDRSKRVISTSFLAVACVGENVSTSAQEFFEFLLHGFFVGTETLLSSVGILDSKKAWKIFPEVKSVPREPVFNSFPIGAGIKQMVEIVANDLVTSFGNLGKAFGGSIGSALSGGYDTRLMLAALRNCGLAPYLHVYGRGDSSDVRVAQLIEKGEKLQLKHIDKELLSDITPQQFADGMERQFFFFDALKPLGGLDDGVDLETRFDRARHGDLQFNGAGGEIYREIWNIPDRRIDMNKFLRLRFDSGSYPYCQPKFDAQEYFSVFSDKVREILGIDRSWLTRRESEMLFPFLRNHFAAANNAANNQISYSLVPFMEPKLIYPSFDIPIKYKYCGRFQGELIKALDPALAKYDSSYGINYFDPIPAAYRLKCFAERQIPLWSRLYKRKLSAGQPQSRPYFLQRQYLEQIVDLDDLRISEFVDIDKMTDPGMLSRALSVELLLSYL